MDLLAVKVTGYDDKRGNFVAWKLRKLISILPMVYVFAGYVLFQGEVGEGCTKVRYTDIHRIIISISIVKILKRQIWC